MTHFTFASQGNFTHDGQDLTSGRRFVTGMAGGNRGIFMGGSEPTRVNKIDYISISNFGSAIDFGDLVEAKDMGGGGAWSNGVIGGGMGGFMSARGTANLLTRATAILAACFFVTSLSLAIIADSGRPKSLADEIKKEETSNIPKAPQAPMSK